MGLRKEANRHHRGGSQGESVRIKLFAVAFLDGAPQSHSEPLVTLMALDANNEGSTETMDAIKIEEALEHRCLRSIMSRKDPKQGFTTTGEGSQKFGLEGSKETMDAIKIEEALEHRCLRTIMSRKDPKQGFL